MITNNNKVAQHWGSSTATENFIARIRGVDPTHLSKADNLIKQAITNALAVYKKDQLRAVDSLSKCFGTNYRCIPYIPKKGTLDTCLDYPYRSKDYHGTVEIIKRKVNGSLDDDYDNISFNIDAPDIVIKALSMLSRNRNTEVDTLCRSMSVEEYRQLVRWARLFEFEDVTCMNHVFGKDVFEIDRGTGVNNTKYTHFTDDVSYTNNILDTDRLARRLRTNIYAFLATKSVDLDNNFSNIDVNNLCRTLKENNSADKALKNYLYDNRCDISDVSSKTHIYFDRNEFLDKYPYIAVYPPKATGVQFSKGKEKRIEYLERSLAGDINSPPVIYRYNSPSNILDYFNYFKNRRPVTEYVRTKDLNEAELYFCEYPTVYNMLEYTLSQKHATGITRSEEYYNFQDNMTKCYLAKTRPGCSDEKKANLLKIFNDSIDKLGEYINYIESSDYYNMELSRSGLSRDKLLSVADCEVYINDTIEWRIIKIPKDNIQNYNILNMPKYYSFTSASVSVAPHGVDKFGWIYPLAFYECLCGDRAIKATKVDVIYLKNMAECLYRSKNFVCYSAIRQFAPINEDELYVMCKNRGSFSELDNTLAQLVNLNSLDMNANIYGTCDIFTTVSSDQKQYIGQINNGLISVKNDGWLRLNDPTKSISICTNIAYDNNIMTKNMAEELLKDLNGALAEIGYPYSIDPTSLMIEFDDNDEMVIGSQNIGARCEQLILDIRRHTEANPYSLD
jgi:hypothetical protein